MADLRVWRRPHGHELGKNSICCHVLNPETWKLQTACQAPANLPSSRSSLVWWVLVALFLGPRTSPNPVLSTGASFPAPEAQLCSAS